jgi:hypothetical protein
MAYTPPNVFVNGTSLDATLVQANNDAMKTYIDGGAVTGDVSTATWVRAPHIMRGTYIPLQNLHEFATGAVRGATFTQNDVVMSADKFRTTYPAFKGGNENIAVEFTNESSSFITRLGWQVFPKHIPLDTTPTTTVGQLTQTTVGTNYPAYTCQENDAGNYRNTVATFENGITGVYRRRAIQNWEYQDITSATVGLNIATQWYVGTNNIVNDFADFGYELEVYYR